MTDVYREDAGRFAKLEARLNGLEGSKFYETVKWGIIAFLFLLGVATIVFSAAFGDERSARGRAVQITAEVAQVGAEIERSAADLEAQDHAREHCAEACEGHGMQIELARLTRSEGAWRASSCSCGSARGHRTLWNDDVSVDDRLRDQCAQSCQNAGMKLGRAVLRSRPAPAQPEQRDQYGNRIPRTHIEYLREISACACVNEHRSRTLWDDRVSHSSTCELRVVDGEASCHYTREAVQSARPAAPATMSP